MYSTMYDNIVNWLLNIPLVAFIILVVVVLMAIPQIRDGIKTILSMLKKKEVFVYEVDNEKITFEEKLISRDFDIVKINATTHWLGIIAERKWLEHKYPGYKNCMQILNHIQTNEGIKTFDILPIEREDIKKKIYFDITSFYKGASVSVLKNVGDYAEEKIKSIYQ